MTTNKPIKGGFTVHEIEQMAKKYRFEVFFLSAFVLATLFSKIFDVMGYSLFLTMIGSIIGMVFPVKLDKILSSVLEFICKQEKITQIILGSIFVLISIVLAPVTFFAIGSFAGKALHRDTAMIKSQYADQNQDDESGHA